MERQHGNKETAGKSEQPVFPFLADKSEARGELSMSSDAPSPEEKGEEEEGIQKDAGDSEMAIHGDEKSQKRQTDDAQNHEKRERKAKKNPDFFLCRKRYIHQLEQQGKREGCPNKTEYTAYPEKGCLQNRRSGHMYDRHGSRKIFHEQNSFQKKPPRCGSFENQKSRELR
jgi:hypothetical protein